MKTIKTKLFLLFALFMVSFVLCGILLNALFLERYYIYKNRDTFIETSEKITKEYRNNKKNIPDLIDLIDRIDGVSCTITDPNLNTLYNSFPQKSDPDAKRQPKEIEQLILDNSTKLLRSYVYTIVEKPYDQAPKLVFMSRMNTGELIILKKPMKGISESVAIANQFYLLAGIIILSIGGVVIFLFSSKITRPVIEMSVVAEEIANLIFIKRVTINSQDELGSLGKSINKIAEKLSASLDELKQDVERRKQLVRNMSHELKTPIGVIKGYAEGLKYGVVEDQVKMQKYCNVIVEECDQMDRMVRELLNLSMLESGTFQLQISRFSLAKLIKEVGERFAPLIVQKEITLELECAEDCLVAADYELLERVLNNFMTNAINHIGGRKYIKVAAQQKESGVRITVFNTGKHIPDHDLKEIWSVFYKVDQARSREYGGHGLGLSIVRLISQLHEGITGVENEGEGVLFYIELP